MHRIEKPKIQYRRWKITVGVTRWFCSSCKQEWKKNHSLAEPCALCQHPYSCAVTFPNNKPQTKQEMEEYALAINKLLL